MTLQYMYTMMTKYYCVAPALQGLSAASEERGAKQNLARYLPIQRTCRVLAAGKAALPSGQMLVHSARLTQPHRSYKTLTHVDNHSKVTRS